MVAAHSGTRRAVLVYPFSSGSDLHCIITAQHLLHQAGKSQLLLAWLCKQLCFLCP